MTADFEKALGEYMRKLHITQKSEAIRRAVREAVDNLRRSTKSTDFHEWIGLGLKAPLNRKPRFLSEDNLWE